MAPALIYRFARTGARKVRASSRETINQDVGLDYPRFKEPASMPKRRITVGHSPDPDDAFMFYALAHDKLDTGDLVFRHELQDIETLNRRALKGELEVTAVSIHAYAYLLDKYALLPSGCSMGDRYGPMVVARNKLPISDLKKS